MGIGNYARHAKIWDWGGYDNTPEHEYWCKYAESYGRNVLIPMCALAETGAYMAQHGYSVVAFDLTPEMIEESRKRFGALENLALRQGDIRDFSFDIPPVDFVFLKDMGHLLTIDDVESAFAHLSFHMRDGGALVLE
jgi:SAM-dependent methyltransferase